MNWQTLLDYFRNILTSIDESIPDHEGVSLPNIVFNHHGKNIWIELTLSPRKNEVYTETQQRSHFEVIYGICSPVNRGTMGVNQVAADIAACFSPMIPDKAILPITETMELFVRSVEQSPGTISGEIYKTNVTISCELYTNEE